MDIKLIDLAVVNIQHIALCNAKEKWNHYTFRLVPLWTWISRCYSYCYWAVFEKWSFHLWHKGSLAAIAEPPQLLSPGNSGTNAINGDFTRQMKNNHMKVDGDEGEEGER